MYLPSFLTQLSTLLKVFELKAGLFGSTMREDVLLRSLTTPNAHREEDYDKLEYSGDVVLKCLTSVYMCVRGSRTCLCRAASLTATFAFCG